MRELAYRTSRVFRALGNPLRYRILDRIARGPLCPTDLALELNRPLPVISQHLAILKDLNLVWFHPEPPGYVYSIKYPLVRRFLADAEGCCETLRVEDPPVSTLAPADEPPDL